MNRNAEVASFQERFDSQFPVSSDLRLCLNTVHNSYQLFQIHSGHKDNDQHLEEGLYAVYPVILHCVKNILATGSVSAQNTPCAVRPVSMNTSSPTQNCSQ